MFGLADVGRVYLEGQDSDAWHHAYGGGIWIAFLRPENTFQIAVARSEERTSVYLRAGFQF